MLLPVGKSAVITKVVGYLILRLNFKCLVPQKDQNETKCFTTQMSRLMTKPTKWLCAQRRLRSAWASAQADPSLRWAHSHIGFVMRWLK